VKTIELYLEDQSRNLLKALKVIDVDLLRNSIEEAFMLDNNSVHSMIYLLNLKDKID
jgi:hypothetical protein